MQALTTKENIESLKREDQYKKNIEIFCSNKSVKAQMTLLDALPIIDVNNEIMAELQTDLC